MRDHLGHLGGRSGRDHHEASWIRSVVWDNRGGTSKNRQHAKTTTTTNRERGGEKTTMEGTLKRLVARLVGRCRSGETQKRESRAVILALVWLSIGCWTHPSAGKASNSHAPYWSTESGYWDGGAGWQGHSESYRASQSSRRLSRSYAWVAPWKDVPDWRSDYVPILSVSCEPERTVMAEDNPIESKTVVAVIGISGLPDHITLVGARLDRRALERPNLFEWESRAVSLPVGISVKRKQDEVAPDATLWAGVLWFYADLRATRGPWRFAPEITYDIVYVRPDAREGPYVIWGAEQEAKVNLLQALMHGERVEIQLTYSSLAEEKQKMRIVFPLGGAGQAIKATLLSCSRAWESMVNEVQR